MDDDAYKKDALPLSAEERERTLAYLIGGKPPTGVTARPIASHERLVKAVEKVLGGKWVSLDKDNMEWRYETTCFVLDELRAAIKAPKEQP